MRAFWGSPGPSGSLRNSPEPSGASQTEHDIHHELATKAFWNSSEHSGTLWNSPGLSGALQSPPEPCRAL
eukprot:10361508-Alexandrium_andersonii.AAC.1